MDLKHLAPRTAIVTTLKKHGTVSVNFVATRIGRSSEETGRYLQSLETQGIVLRQGDNVGLTSSDTTTVSGGDLVN